MAIRTFIVLALALALAAAFARADALDAKAADAVVELKDVSVNGGAVSGAIENHGALPVKDVTLAIQHRYRWPNEYKPGAVDPGRAEQTTVSETIPPGGRATFQHDGGPLQAPANGGSFQTTVTVLSFVVIEPAGAPPQP
jgi:hypothetical protein